MVSSLSRGARAREKKEKEKKKTYSTKFPFTRIVYHCAGEYSHGQGLVHLRFSTQRSPGSHLGLSSLLSSQVRPGYSYNLLVFASYKLLLGSQNKQLP